MSDRDTKASSWILRYIQAIDSWFMQMLDFADCVLITSVKFSKKQETCRVGYFEVNLSDMAGTVAGHKFKDQYLYCL